MSIMSSKGHLMHVILGVLIYDDIQHASQAWRSSKLYLILKTFIDNWN